MPLVRINGFILHFVHIPKTGGSFIKSYLESKGPVALHSRSPLDWCRSTPQHMDREAHQILVPDEFCDYSFAILRDPLDRLKSEFRYRVTREAQRSKKLPCPSQDTRLSLELDWNERFSGNFNEWVKEVLDRYRSNAFTLDNHVRPQAEFIAPGTKVFLFDRGFSEVMNWIDLVTETDRCTFERDRNRSINFDIPVDETSKSLIANFYAVDFELIDRVRKSYRTISQGDDGSESSVDWSAVQPTPV